VEHPLVEEIIEASSFRVQNVKKKMRLDQTENWSLSWIYVAQERIEELLLYADTVMRICVSYKAKINIPSVRSNSYSNVYPTRCNVTQFILSGNVSACFAWYHHPSSGAQTTVL